MARGRFISKEISLNEKVDALPDDTTRLLFTWLIVHLDCEGRMFGDAQTVRSIVFPRRRDLSVKKIENCLKNLEKSSLIFRYSVNGNHYLWMKNFEKHQPGLRKDRESQSQIPPIPPDLLQSNDGECPIEVKVQVKDKVQVKEEDKETPLNPPVSQSFSNKEKLRVTTDDVLTAYQDNILLGGTISEEMDHELRAACGRYSPTWVKDAIREAIAQNQPTWRYMVGILKNWSKEGKKEAQ